MSLTSDDLRALPLFHRIRDEHLRELLGVFERQLFRAGETLFEAGATPSRFLILARGEVLLRDGQSSGRDGGAALFRLKPVAPIGELGALTGLARSTTAVTETESEIWSAAIPQLMTFFERHGDVAFPFYRNLLDVVTDKVRRDRRLLGEMRGNLIRTQKAMKNLRQLVLQSAETPLSRPVCDVLDDCIEHNRRAHYRVAPTSTYPAALRLEDGGELPVVEISDGFVKVGAPVGRVASEAVHVLVLPTGEVPVSGTVIREGKDGVVVKLDVLVDPYKEALEDYVTRLQLLDFVV